MPYCSTYEHNGEKKNMAVTQFEPADARRCFPCWDEPACKVLLAVSQSQFLLALECFSCFLLVHGDPIPF